MSRRTSCTRGGGGVGRPLKRTRGTYELKDEDKCNPTSTLKEEEESDSTSDLKEEARATSALKEEENPTRGEG